MGNKYPVIIFAAIMALILTYEFGFTRGQDSERLINAKSHIKIRDVTDSNGHVVYKVLMESQTIYVDKIRTVKEYIHDKKDYSDTRCIPVVGLRGYNASLYDASNSNSATGELYSSQANTNTSEQ